jgi:KUP system potassium uptake protein
LFVGYTTLMTKTNRRLGALTIGALGGDIGTSPLYALQAAFGGHRLAIDHLNVLGVISLVIWSITLVVSLKFVGFILRADNEGEGGILALVSKVKSVKLPRHYTWAYMLVGLIGVSLFYGDSVITPAISVLSAVEGLNVIAPGLSSLVIPITLVVLFALFWVQKFGTGSIGKYFGPVMLVWFASIGAAGGWQVWHHPSILQAISPLAAIEFIVAKPLVAFLAMTAVVLVITGAEALYADLGHFGRPAISKAWFLVVSPALLLCYMGQGALLLYGPRHASNLFLELFPAQLRIPVVLLATVATVIASQAVISGTFSLTRQAVQLNFLPKLLIRHTSSREFGQIYIPFVNFALLIIVSSLVLIFGSSAKLANAYGIAVSGTLLADTILYLVIVRAVWHRSRALLVVAAVTFLPLDLVFITSNSTKLFHGGLIPIVIGGLVLVLFTTWLKGDRIVDAERVAMEGSLQDFIQKIHRASPALRRIPGAAVYIGHHPAYAPLALHATVDEFHELPEKVVVVSILSTTAAHVPIDEQSMLDDLEYEDGISHLTLHYGFLDTINIPKTLERIRKSSPELNFNPDTASYFISHSNVVPTKRHNMARWRKGLYMFMARNASPSSGYYGLPIERTEEMRTLIIL